MIRSECVNCGEDAFLQDVEGVDGAFSRVFECPNGHRLVAKGAGKPTPKSELGELAALNRALDRVGVTGRG